MKIKILSYEDGIFNWIEDENGIEVDEKYFNLGFYDIQEDLSVKLNQEKTDKYKKEQAKIVAQEYLDTTDFVTIQWQEENDRGIEHKRTEKEYMKILQKREEARQTIRASH